ncbi:MAG: hypothetical protein L0Y58_04535, partial [Verrucomicrobia subdivision 3 bacterium]|nr:hypothetical protein [Limisphaerales bacterium]
MKGSRLNLKGVVPLVLSAVLLAGCSTSKERQLQRVAKDWCTTIRASQVMPVYPLTEDLQPGDVFLVQVPLDQQQKIYKERGFLPLDYHIERLNPDGYTNYYANSFLADANGPLLPRDWIRPSGTNVSAWEPAPHVAFPSYSFSVRRGVGLDLAVPVQGVPVGLSLLGSDAAEGSVSIKNARTMGVDAISLYRQLETWARKNSDFLRYFGPGASQKRTNLLRVVTRVFATGQMDVNLRDASSRAGGVDVGAPKPVDLLSVNLATNNGDTPGTVVTNFNNAWSVLTNMVRHAGARDAAGNFLPGGSLRLSAASARSVTLHEPFDPPVILGYLGFDCAISEGGVLGPPIPTQAVIDPAYKLGHLLHASPAATVYSEAAKQGIYGVLRALPDEPQARDIVA